MKTDVKCRFGMTSFAVGADLLHVLHLVLCRRNLTGFHQRFQRRRCCPSAETTVSFKQDRAALFVH